MIYSVQTGMWYNCLQLMKDTDSFVCLTTFNIYLFIECIITIYSKRRMLLTWTKLNFILIEKEWWMSGFVFLSGEKSSCACLVRSGLNDIFHWHDRYCIFNRSVLTFSVNVTKSQFSANLVTFTEEILNGKLHFLCSVNS